MSGLIGNRISGLIDNPSVGKPVYFIIMPLYFRKVLESYVFIRYKVNHALGHDLPFRLSDAAPPPIFHLNFSNEVRPTLAMIIKGQILDISEAV